MDEYGEGYNDHHSEGFDIDVKPFEPVVKEEQSSEPEPSPQWSHGIPKLVKQDVQTESDYSDDIAEDDYFDGNTGEPEVSEVVSKSNRSSQNCGINSCDKTVIKPVKKRKNQRTHPRESEDVLDDNEEYQPLSKKSKKYKPKKQSGINKCSKTKQAVGETPLKSSADVSDIPTETIPLDNDNEEITTVGKKTLKRWKERENSTQDVQCYLCSEMMLEKEVIEHTNEKHTGTFVRSKVTYGDKRPFQCHVCKASLKRELGKSYHVCYALLPRDKTNPPFCEKCKMVFKTVVLLIVHLGSEHGTTRPFKCTYCEYGAVSAKLLYSHAMKMHGESKAKRVEKAFKCHRCVYSTNTSTLLGLHLQRVHENRKQKPEAEFKCTFCSFESTSRNVWRKHLIKEHNAEKNPKGHFPCTVAGCKEVFYNERGINTHNTTKHNKPREEKVTCEICGYAAPAKGLLNQHIRWEHANDLEIAKIECKCEKCQKEFPTAVDLNDHLASCLDDNINFKCTMCNTDNWHSAISLRRHVVQTHRKVREVCNVCGKILTSGLKLHKANIHEGGAFSCDLCGKKLASKYGLGKHIMAFHENNRPFSCEDCDKTFVTFENYNRHRQAKHIREVKYKCPHCSYFTYLVNVIPKHILEVHDRVKRQNCKSCDAGYFYKRDLVKHLAAYPTHVGNFYDSKTLS